jgi:hypothetical protein
MKYSYQLQLNDLLQHNLFWLTKNKVFMVHRRNRIIKISALYFIIYLFFLYFEIGYPEFQYIFPVIAISFLLYEIYYGEKKTLEKAHTKMILNENSHQLNKTTVLTFEDAFLTKTNDLSNLKVAYENIELVEELSGYFYLKLKTGDRIIFPKSAINDVEEFTLFLHKISKQHKIVLIDETKWKW